MICQVCGTEFEAKRSTARFCSEKCKQLNKRHAKPSDTLNDTVTKPKTLSVSDDAPTFIDMHPPRMTKTDLKFDMDCIGYYKFDQPESKRMCIQCGADFKTRLELLKTCSPGCQQKLLKRLAGMKAAR